MKTALLVLGLLSMATLPSCMHANSQARGLQDQDRPLCMGACDSVGEFSAQYAAKGLTLELATAQEASAQPLR